MPPETGTVLENTYHTVSNKVSWAPFGSIQLCPQDPRNISNRDLQRTRSRPLGLTRNVVRGPAHDDGCGREHSRDGQNRPGI